MRREITLAAVALKSARNRGGVIKFDAIYPQEECPDCGYALFWKEK